MLITTNVVLDPAGFPMVQVDTGSERFYVHWLPVTKIQFEYFICAAPNAKFNDAWYQEIRDLSPRIAPQNASLKDYWQLFITGIKPDEVNEFAKWCRSDGKKYKMLTREQWVAVYRAVKDEPAIALAEIKQGLDLKPRVSTLLDQTDELLRTKLGARLKLADQMLLRNGVIEWCQYNFRGQEWCGLGASVFVGSMLQNPEEPQIFPKPDDHRNRHYGFRLVRS